MMPCSHTYTMRTRHLDPPLCTKNSMLSPGSNGTTEALYHLPMALPWLLALTICIVSIPCNARVLVCECVCMCVCMCVFVCVYMLVCKCTCMVMHAGIDMPMAAQTHSSATCPSVYTRARRPARCKPYP